MDKVEQQIFRYGELSDTERDALEQAVAQTPDLQKLLDEVKRLENEFRSVYIPSPESHSVPDALLALYAVHEAHDIASSEALSPFFSKLEDRLSTDAELASRLRPMQERAREAQQTFDLAQHFASVTGHTLEDLPVQGELEKSNPSSAAERTTKADRATRSPQRPSNRSEVRDRFVSYAWYAGIATAAAILLYGVLFVFSMATQSPAERMAVLDSAEMQIEGYQVRTRSAVEATADNDERFLMALHLLDEAHSSILGLFPRFDPAKIEEARDLLQQVVDAEEPSSFLQLEAYFFLGKTHLSQEEVESARTAFQRVVVNEGRRAPEASRLLEEIERHYPVEVDFIPEEHSL